MRSVREFMTRTVVTIHRDKRISAAAGVFDDEEIGGAPVVDDDGAIVGVLTQSDIVHFTSIGGDAIEGRVSEIASRLPLTIEASSPLADAARLMMTHHVHRLIVMEDDEMVGILTSMDFVALALESHEPVA